MCFIFNRSIFLLNSSKQLKKCTRNLSLISKNIPICLKKSQQFSRTNFLKPINTRFYGAIEGVRSVLNRDQITTKVIETIKRHEKVDISKLFTVSGLILKRTYAHKPEVTYNEIEARVMLVLRLYDKINPETLNLESNFTSDLGLDSLDHVEIIMAMEEEFIHEIPDIDAEKLLRPVDIINYIADREEAYKESIQDLKKDIDDVNVRP